MNGAAGGPTRVRIDADLSVEVDGLPARVTSRGDVVQVVADRPLALVRKVSATSVPRPVRGSMPDWGKQLAEHGIRLELRSPRGLVGAMGAPSNASPGRAIGDWRVESGPARVVAVEAAREAGAAARQHRGILITVLAALALVMGFRALRHVRDR